MTLGSRYGICRKIRGRYTDAARFLELPEIVSADEWTRHVRSRDIGNNERAGLQNDMELYTELRLRCIIAMMVVNSYARGYSAVNPSHFGVIWVLIIIIYFLLSYIQHGVFSLTHYRLCLSILFKLNLLQKHIT